MKYLLTQAKILLSFSREGDFKLLNLLATAMGAIGLIQEFRSLSALQDRVNIVLGDYKKALEASVRGGSAEKAQKNHQKQLLIEAMRALVDAINLAANGSRPLLERTKLPLSKDASRPIELEPVKKFTVTPGQSGEMVATIKKGKGVISSIFQLTLDEQVTPQTLWTTAATITESKFTFTDLPVGKYVSFRVVVTGTKKQSLKTDVVKKMVA